MAQLVRFPSPDDAGALGAWAQQLAQALRTSRLTVVVAPAGAGKSRLLAGVLPLLRRRAIDVSRADSAAPGVVVPFPDRRSRAADGAQHEQIHTIDHWDDASMQSLQRALDADGPGRTRRLLADALTPVSLVDHIERHGGARLLFVFDHFEELLEAARVRVGHRRLVETWAAAVRSPQLRANFLVAVDEKSWPWLHAVCVGLPHGAWSALRLNPQGATLALEPIGRPLQVPTTQARAALGISPRSGRAQTGAQFLHSVNERVRRVAQSARDQRMRDGNVVAKPPQLVEAPAPRPAAAPAAAMPIAETPVAEVPITEVPTAKAPPPSVLTPVPVIEDAVPPVAPAAPSEAPETQPIDEAPAPVQVMPAPRRRPVPTLAGLAALVFGMGLFAWWWHATSEAPSVATIPPAVATAAPAAPAPVTTPAAHTPPAPQTAPAVAAEAAPSTNGAYSVLGVSAAGEHGRIARELVAALPGGAAATRVEPLARDVDPVAWLQQAPGRLGIAHWDALRAAPHGGPAVPLRVLTPLFAEPVLFVVRADSPLRFIRQLQGKRIGVGPAHSDAAHTVRELYRRLFDAPLSNTTTLAPDEALAELVAFQSVDAIAVVDAQPMAWWNALDPSTARRLRVLTLAPGHPKDRRLLQSLGTEPMRVAMPGGQRAAATVPTVMSYLVASGDGDAPAERLAAMAQALCRELPQLQKLGHPAWRNLWPRAQTDTGWPVMGAFRTTLSRCVRG